MRPCCGPYNWEIRPIQRASPVNHDQRVPQPRQQDQWQQFPDPRLPKEHARLSGAWRSEEIAGRPPFWSEAQIDLDPQSKRFSAKPLLPQENGAFLISQQKLYRVGLS